MKVGIKIRFLALRTSGSYPSLQNPADLKVQFDASTYLIFNGEMNQELMITEGNVHVPAAY